MSGTIKHTAVTTLKQSDHKDNNDKVRFLEEVNSIRRALLHRLDRKWRQVDEQYSMTDKLTLARAWASGHPVITVFLLTTFVICALPLVCFLTSLAGIVCIVCLGFLFFEGTLLTLGVSVLGVLFTFGAFLSISFSGCVIFGYLCLQYSRQWSCRFNRLSKEEHKKRRKT